MRRFWPRLLKSVLPVTLLCGAAGYLYAVAAGSYVADPRDDGSTLRDTLLWRVPFAMAAWGGGFTLLVEWFRHMWGAKKNDAKAEAATPPPSAEQILMQLLEQAEEAERSRQFPVPPPRSLTDTPLPAGLPAIPGQPTPAA